MNMSNWRQRLPLVLTLLVIVCTLLFSLPASAATARKESVSQHKASAKAKTAPTPFMHKPYYGTRSISSRTVSFVDHDHPWYDNDGVFVRYDGAKWTNVSIGSCTAGVNCYDGHNGYDLNMWYEPVLSAAAGTVTRAGWYNPLDHNSSLGLWVAIDHGNGYTTAYGHLSAITVAVGDQVGTQWQIGTSGTTGSSTGPHLHMATYYLPYWQATDPFGWTGNYTDPNAVPDNYLWVSDTSNTNPVPTLSSNGSATYPGATVVDDGSTGWSSTGAWTSASGSSFINGKLHWASTSSSSATATSTWHPTISADGYYEVGAFVDDNYASSSYVPYTVYSADPNHAGVEVPHNVIVDESHIGVFQGPYSQENTGPQWIGLGTYYFKASMNGRLVMSNATGETGLQIAADAVEFVPVSVQPTAPPPVYNFQVTKDTSPTTLLPGAKAMVNLTVKNTSNFAWNGGTSTTSPVQVVYRWINAQGKTVATGAPVTLPQSVSVNGTIALSLTIQAPLQFGTYTLQWDLQQGTKIFSQQGATTKNDIAKVVASTREGYPHTELRGI